MNTKFKLLIVPLYVIFLVGCHKGTNDIIKPTDTAIFPTSQKDIQNVAIFKEVGSILKKVYQNPKAYFEVVSTIYSGYYDDERVLLKDLIFPENSPLYKTIKFKNFHSPIGLFKEKFLSELYKGNYPNLKNAMGIQNANLRTTYGGIDSTAEIFTNSSGVSIYFPYSENFVTTYTTAYFDNINVDPFGEFATIVSSDREADSAPGDEPFRKKNYDDNGDIYWTIEFISVITDDVYADLKPTHLVGAGAQPLKIDQPQDPPPPSPFYRVFSGWNKINHRVQYDKFVSFNSANGGGSDIKICRISGYLHFDNQQVTNFTGDVIPATFTRRDINRGHWRRNYGIWDPDWNVNNTEQTYAVYEEDNEGTETFNGSLSTTLTAGTTSGTVTAGSSVVGTIGYSITVKTQDQLIRQLKIGRDAYFAGAKNDQGWGFNLCDTKSGTCRLDNTFLTTGSWPIYDGGADWSYTWPYTIY